MGRGLIAIQIARECRGRRLGLDSIGQTGMVVGLMYLQSDRGRYDHWVCMLAGQECCNGLRGRSEMGYQEIVGRSSSNGLRWMDPGQNYRRLVLRGWRVEYALGNYSSVSCRLCKLSWRRFVICPFLVVRTRIRAKPAVGCHGGYPFRQAGGVAIGPWPF